MAYLPTPQQLRYLVTLAETGHFSRAASTCLVSQSTLSAGILALERGLDAQILDRSVAKHAVFTPLGLELVAKAKSALRALASVAEAADAARAPMSGPLRLGVIPTIGPFLLPRLMPALRQEFPALKLFLREDLTDRLLNQLEAGQLDILLLAEPYAFGSGVETLPLARDEFLAALPSNHGLAAGESVSTAELVAEQFLLLEEGHCLRDQVLSVCNAAVREPRFAATSLLTLIQMVAGGLGVSLVPRLAVSAGLAEGTGVVLRRLDGPSCWRTISLAWRPESPRAAEYRVLARLMMQACG
jgi:LysR family hydrogen peroxide-inducible transcriptional activator